MKLSEALNTNFSGGANKRELVEGVANSFDEFISSDEGKAIQTEFKFKAQLGFITSIKNMFKRGEISAIKHNAFVSSRSGHYEFTKIELRLTPKATPESVVNLIKQARADNFSMFSKNLLVFDWD